jgi:aldehyde:ferredoxin oxidoreductase
VGRDKDTLPQKLFKPLKGGRSDGLFISKEELEAALDMYYDLAGWDKTTGNPTPTKLAELGLEWILELDTTPANSTGETSA